MIYFVAFLLLGSGIAFGDDTEIYGANEVDNTNAIQSNVLFVMDTSGSMAGDVENTLIPYNSSQSYSGRYYTSDFYNNVNDDPSDGHKRSAFEKSSSYECRETLSNLDSQGKVLGDFQQYRNGWRDLKDGSDNTIRCDRGKAVWLYSGNYMNWYHDPNNVTTSTRMEVVVDVVNELTHSLKNINLGLMRFDQDAEGGMIDVPVSDISTSGPQIRSKLAQYYPKGGTPLEETLYEASRYYRGDSVIFGRGSRPNESVSDSRIGNLYKSPIEATCQKNHVILLTDGEPTVDESANGYVRSRVANMVLPTGLSKSCSGDGDCLDELAYWMKNTDHSKDHIGNQEITTYTIGGFNLANGVELLKRTANWGGGKYFEANDTQGLTNALESIFLDILSTDSTFTAPAVSVNAFNATEHNDELFYALFRPDDNVRWAGNLKKYKLTENGLVVGARSNTPAISEATGFFNEGVFDYWNKSDQPDGKKIDKGGAANLMLPHNRNIYSEDSVNYLGSFQSFANETTFDMIGEGWDRFVKVRDWTKGYDVDDSDGDGDTFDSRYTIGDPLHSEPVVINYGGTKDNPVASIFFGTNEGFIHAMDTETGRERYAFLPTELHKIQKHYYDNALAAKDKPYGMDGFISAWFYDDNNNNRLLTSSGSIEANEHIYIYAGMRRGGRNYYALDVSNPDKPRMLFKIEGGKGDFKKLGQTWSKAIPTKVKFNGKSRYVLFFSGGYDESQDNNNFYQEDSMGNAIYMVDAETGERLWWASNSGADLNIPLMVNSMPASVTAIDITGDGFINYLFAADMGGRVFRIDLNPDNSGPNDFAKGDAIGIFNLGTEETNRRFYNKPNVSLVKDKQNGDYLTISIGSGHRAHPILTKKVENRFYVLRDFNPYSAPDNYTPKMEAPEWETTLPPGGVANKYRLYNATSLMKQGEKVLTHGLQTLIKGGGGFYVTFDEIGEKVLSQSTTFSGAIIFTTFSPTGGSSISCGADLGTARMYVLDQKWATAKIDLNGDGDVDEKDTSKILSHSGIAPRPVIIYRKDGGKTIAIGTETFDDDRFEQKPSSQNCKKNGTCEQQVKACEKNNCNVIPVYWRQNSNNN